jgi:hypothetical protein
MTPFAPFEPDKSPFNETSSDAVVNAIPVADGWGPFPSFTALSTSLGAECRGAITGRANDGSYIIFAFTAQKAYRYVQSTAIWLDVSRATPYSLNINEYWSILQFGSYIVASNISNEMQVFNIETDIVFSNLAGSPPRAKYIWACGGYLFAGNTDSGSDRIYNSALEDIGNWTIGLAGADYQAGGGAGEVVGGIGDQQGGYVFYSDRVRRIQLTPNTGYTYSLTDVNTSRHTPAPYSIVSIGPNDFVHYCDDGWFRGPQSQPIGAQRVDDWFRRLVDPNQIKQIQGAADPISKIAWFAFTTVDNVVKVLGYHWELNRWTTIDTTQSYLVPLITSSYTLEDIGALYPILETVPYSLDSSVWVGGRPSFAGFTKDGGFGFFSGPNMAVNMETALVQHSNDRAFVNSVRIVSDAPNVTLQIGTRATHYGTTSWKPAVSPSIYSGLCPARSSGRLFKYRALIPAGEEWSVAHGVDVSAVSEGAR